MKKIITYESVIFFLALSVLSGCTKKQSVSFKDTDQVILLDNQTNKNKLITRTTALEPINKAIKQVKHSQQQQQLILRQKTYKQIEAGLVDIPVPLLAKPVCASGDMQETYYLEYLIELPLAEVSQFYVIEMERSGWDKGVVFSHTKETVLSFKKRTGACVVILKPKITWWNSKKRTHASLYVS